MSTETRPESAQAPSSKTLLILGGTGKLGQLMRRLSELAPELLDGWSPIWVGRRAEDGIDHVISDHTSDADIPKAQAVLALWGVVPGQGDLADNIRLAMRAIEIAQTCGAQRVLHCSSSAVYGPGKDCDETAALSPVNAYGLAKIEMEQSLSLANSSAANMPLSCALRIANVVGCDSLFGAMSSGNPVTLDGFEIGSSPVRSYATPRLVWRAVTALLKTPDMPEIVNVAASNPVSMHALLDAANYPYIWRPAPFTAVREVSMDMRLMRELTGDTLHVDPAEMVAEWRRVKEALA